MNNLKIERIARLCHELNRQICEVVGDFSQLPWQLTPDSIKQSAISGVKSHLENPNLTPEESHELWMAYKIKEGWTRGSVKDLEAKTHPLLCDYSELALTDRLKDHVFSAAVKYAKEI